MSGSRVNDRSDPCPYWSRNACAFKNVAGWTSSSVRLANRESDPAVTRRHHIGHRAHWGGEEATHPKTRLGARWNLTRFVQPCLPVVGVPRSEAHRGSTHRGDVWRIGRNSNSIWATIAASATVVTRRAESGDSGGCRTREHFIHGLRICRGSLILAVYEAVADDVNAILDHLVEDRFEAGAGSRRRPLVHHHLCSRRGIQGRIDANQYITLARGARLERGAAAHADLADLIQETCGKAIQRQHVSHIAHLEGAERNHANFLSRAIGRGVQCFSNT